MKLFVFSWLLLVALVVSMPAMAFNGEWLMTIKWVPASSANICAIGDSLGSLGGSADCIVVYSDSDVELAIGHWRNAYTPALAQTNIATVLEESHTVPAAGKVYQGRIKWLAAEAHPDTVYIDCYKRLAWPR